MIDLINTLETALHLAEQDPLRGRRDVYLYGAGTTGQDVIRLLNGKGINVRAVLDAKSGLSSLDGIPVLRPDDGRFSKLEKEQALLVIGVFNAFLPMPELLAKLRELGWKNITGFLELHRNNHAALGDRYWLTSPGFYKKDPSLWQNTDGMWADDESHDLYKSILKFRFTGNYDDAPVPDSDTQYCPGKLPRWNSNLRFIDCGAFDGDTLAGIGGDGYAFDAVAVFEPDATNLRKLAARIPELAPSASPAVLWPCGVFSATTQLKFASGNGAGSAISHSGDTVVQCISIDEALFGFGPNLIKMDIEGAEPDALLGARKTIEKHRPGLAICVYHHPAHLWQIPNLIRSWDLGYKLYLRAHCHNGFDVVMYAVPN
jgi:FkbM family methyltransferase